jgi:CubicO group peptidase (beta-lactamase class C family)
MKKSIASKIITTLFLLLFPALPNVFSQEVIPLKKGTLYEKEIGVNASHSYQISLKTDQYFLGMVMQKGIDLMVVTYGPDGKKINDYDSPNGKSGSEYFNIEPAVAGDYRIEVRPLDEKQETGHYTLEILKWEPKAKTKEGRVTQLFSAWDRKDSPGATVAVVQNGKIIYKNGFGSANLEYGIPNTPSTVYHIASVSKQFTCFAIAQLADEGKISLDDDIRKYLPEVPDFGKTITIRHLCHHTSGLRDQWNLLALAGWRLDDVITTEHVLKLVANQKELNFDPGNEFLYCNTGFTLLGEIVARVSGMTFAEYCAKNIFQPLGMKSTLFYDDHEKIVPNRAYSYNEAGAGYKKSVLSYANAGATSLFTTVEDLSKWALNFENIKVGNEQIMAEMHRRGVLNSNFPTGYALGQAIDTYKGLNRVSHGGADAGYRTFLARFPDQQFSVIVFSNLGSFNTGGIAMQIADIYLEDKMDKPAPKPVEKEKAEVSQKAEVSPTEEVRVDPNVLKTYCGQYELQPGFMIAISEENGQLFGQGTGQPRVQLTPNSETEFTVESIGAVITFDKNDEGNIHQLTLKQGGGEFKAPRMVDFDPAKVDLSVYTGQFYSEELGTAYTFLVENNKLTARHSRHSDIGCTPTKADTFSGNQWFFGQVEFVKNAGGQVTGCKISSGRVRGVWFQKE